MPASVCPECLPDCSNNHNIEASMNECESSPESDQEPTAIFFSRPKNSQFIRVFKKIIFRRKVVKRRRKTCCCGVSPNRITVIIALILTLSPDNVEKRQAFKHQLKPPPLKLTEGCPAELLHFHSFHHFPQTCRVQPPLAIVAYEGILDAMELCREHMRFQTWDCTHISTVLHEPTLLQYGYKQSAYVWAMSAAGAAWGIASACVEGWLKECGCAASPSFSGIKHSRPRFQIAPTSSSPQLNDDWKWNGCSYGVHYGLLTSRKLLTRISTKRVHTERKKNILRKLEKHNLKAGRLAVKKTLISSCKCHGVSGSCQQKTCWKRPPELASIANHLTEKYKHAQQVINNDFYKVRSSDLIFMEQSPNTCTHFYYESQRKRSLPRVCNLRNETHSQGDCDLLCCNRGYSISHEVISYKCDCKFVWCCKLVCSECTANRWVSTCNP